MIKKVIIAAMLASSLAGITPSANAEIIVRRAPPPLRVEAVPSPRHGYVWVAGHWGWQDRHHKWVRGTWIRERRGYQYSQPSWVERNGRWHMAQGRWTPTRADRDGDGVSNRQDRAPNNPNRN